MNAYASVPIAGHLLSPHDVAVGHTSLPLSNGTEVRRRARSDTLPHPTASARRWMGKMWTGRGEEGYVQLVAGGCGEEVDVLCVVVAVRGVVNGKGQSTGGNVMHSRQFNDGG